MSAEYMQNSYIVSTYLSGAASGTSELLSTKVDLNNSTLGSFSNLTFILSTAAADGGAVTFTIKESSDDSTYTAISGATLTTTASTAGTYMIDVNLGGPRLRYYKVSLTPATNVATRTLSCIAIGTNPAFGVNGASEATRATNAGLVARAVV
jgi:hypothetical protein